MNYPNVLPDAAPSNSKIVSTHVVNARGEKLGDIKRVCVDGRTGEVNCVVISCDGFLGMRGNLFAVPFSEFKFDVERDGYALDIDQPVIALPVV